MGFFTTFAAWLNAQLATYIGDNTARLASVLEPAVVTLATIYVMAWGYLHLTGKIDEPVIAGLKRILMLALILGMGLRLWLYNTVIVDTFYIAPTQLAAAMVGGADPVGTIDAIWDRGGAVAGILWTKGSSSLSWGSPGFLIAGALVWCLIGLLCVYAMFLLALSSIALSVLLAVGPLFIALLLFDATKRFFAAWIAQLANYALITVLTVMVAALLLQIVQSYVTQTAALGTAIHTVDILHMLLVAALVFLVLRQVMPIAGGLAGGVSLSSFGVLSRSLSRGSGVGLRAGRASAPALGLAALYTARRLGDTVRPFIQPVRCEVVQSSQPVDRSAGAGTEALSRDWRNLRR
jgi:type IV secretion system protein VirB6